MVFNVHSFGNTGMACLISVGELMLVFNVHSSSDTYCGLSHFRM